MNDSRDFPSGPRQYPYPDDAIHGADLPASGGGMKRSHGASKVAFGLWLSVMGCVVVVLVGFTVPSGAGPGSFLFGLLVLLVLLALIHWVVAATLIALFFSILGHRKSPTLFAKIVSVLAFCNFGVLGALFIWMLVQRSNML